MPVCFHSQDDFLAAPENGPGPSTPKPPWRFGSVIGGGGPFSAFFWVRLFFTAASVPPTAVPPAKEDGEMKDGDDWEYPGYLQWCNLCHQRSYVREKVCLNGYCKLSYLRHNFDLNKMKAWGGKMAEESTTASLEKSVFRSRTTTKKKNQGWVSEPQGTPHMHPPVELDGASRAASSNADGNAGGLEPSKVQRGLA